MLTATIPALLARVAHLGNWRLQHLFVIVHCAMKGIILTWEMQSAHPAALGTFQIQKDKRVVNHVKLGPLLARLGARPVFLATSDITIRMLGKAIALLVHLIHLPIRKVACRATSVQKIHYAYLLLHILFKLAPTGHLHTFGIPTMLALTLPMQIRVTLYNLQESVPFHLELLRLPLF